MGQSRRFVVAAAMLAALGAAWALWSVAAGATLQGRIKTAAAKGHGTQIVIADLTDFPWTRLHVFDPYSPGEWNLTALECTPEDPDVLDMSDEEGSALLVFRGDRCVERAERISRSGSDFAGAGPRARAAVSRADARFIVRVEDHGEPWTVLRLASDSAATAGATRDGLSWSRRSRSAAAPVAMHYRRAR
jgi:hypothetical protein